MVLRLLRGEALDAVSREDGVEVYRLEAWKTRALAGLELGLKARAGEALVTKTGGFEVRKEAGKSVFVWRKARGRKASSRVSGAA